MIEGPMNILSAVSHIFIGAFAEIAIRLSPFVLAFRTPCRTLRQLCRLRALGLGHRERKSVFSRWAFCLPLLLLSVLSEGCDSESQKPTQSQPRAPAVESDAPQEKVGGTAYASLDDAFAVLRTDPASLKRLTELGPRKDMQVLDTALARLFPEGTRLKGEAAVVHILNYVGQVSSSGDAEAAQGVFRHCVRLWRDRITVATSNRSPRDRGETPMKRGRWDDSPRTSALGFPLSRPLCRNSMRRCLAMPFPSYLRKDRWCLSHSSSTCVGQAASACL